MAPRPDSLTTLKSHRPDTRIVSVCDREGDLYDLFVAERAVGVDWLVRAAWNRRVEHAEGYLWEAMLSCPVLATTSLQIPGRGAQAERLAQMEIRCAPIRLRKPNHNKLNKSSEADIYAVCAIESAAPEGHEPVEWMLLTSVPTHTMEEAIERLA